ncbi:S8/S53 family peptidase [Bdellovibrio sp. SKB1291214]|uniref:S8/S53 family peptidase n=1 Tax=Bdellovibrio sp. SKB1291214 TaxID=1732569 RepID=UPI000B51B464|nr:S8/S53 family peptidase [Bdellovibrio sp. SKB1291214]UYL07792.1 S8/S53 family peptidase [Bdellovibrio sp. SKB1291214]
MALNLRRLVAPLILLLSSVAHSFVELEDRQPLDVEGGRLTPYWAQEYIGADLVKEELRRISDLKPVPFAIYDGGFEKQYIHLLRDIPVDREEDRGRKMRANHGTKVANLINGRGMISVSELVDYVQLRRVNPGAFYFQAIEEISKLQNPPMIISNSMGWPGEKVTALAEKLDHQGLIWVLAGGNNHPEPVESYEQTPHVIIAGSYSPRGLQTIYSQESKELDILAPSDDYLASINASGEADLFGATSGAAPLISGTIANLKALLPSLNRAQADLLLKRTAHPSLHRLYSNINHAGLLNSYKAVRVAMKVRELCDSEASCVAKELESKRNFTFPPLAMSDAIKSVCNNPTQVLNKEDTETLRKNFLLNSEKVEYSKMLACAYRNEGYSINADYYENMALIRTSPAKLQDKIRIQAGEAVIHNYSESAALRDLNLLDANFKKALQTAIKQDTGLGRFNAEIYLNRLKSIKPIQLPAYVP